MSRVRFFWQFFRLCAGFGSPAIPTLPHPSRLNFRSFVVAIEGYDLVMLGVLAATALLGYFKGMVWQLAWIAGIVLSGFVSLRFGAQFAPYFGQQAPWNRFASMLALYVATSLAVWIVFRIVSGALNAVHLSAFDHQLGLLFGIAKGALLCVVITVFAVMLAPAYRPQVVASQSGRLVADLLVRADTFLPKEVHETIDPFVRQFEEQFHRSGGQPATGAATNPGAFVSDQGTSPLQAIWNSVGSAAAWAGAEQGGGRGQGGAAMGQGVTQAGGLPAGSSWFVPHAPAPASTQPAGYQSPVNPSPSVFTAQPIAPPQQPPPQAFPPGAQSPLRLR
jgi:membrane protein required for colicin V production